MSTIYLISTQGRLNKKGETLILHMDENTSKTIFPFKTEQLVLIGNIDISTPALKFLMHHKIDTVFMNKNGRFNGRLAFTSGKNVFLRQKQFELIKDEEFCLNFARAIVNAKIRNQLSFMQRIGRKGREKDKVKEQTHRLKTLLEKIPETDNLKSLRGYEGSAARAYFSVFGGAIIQDYAVFNGRSMNPPRDNVNAVLSFIYTMIRYD